MEIESISDEQTIRNFEDKVDLYPMTEGARKAILRKLAELHQRSSRLEVFSKVSSTLGYTCSFSGPMYMFFS